MGWGFNALLIHTRNMLSLDLSQLKDKYCWRGDGCKFTEWIMKGFQINKTFICEFSDQKMNITAKIWPVKYR